MPRHEQDERQARHRRSEKQHREVSYEALMAPVHTVSHGCRVAETQTSV